MAQDNESGEKTEEATPRRREEAREKGQVAFSTEFVAGFCLLSVLGLYLLTSDRVFEILGKGVRQALLNIGSVGRGELDLPTATGLLRSMGGDGYEAILVVALPLLGLTLLLGYGQVGLHISPKALEWDLSKLNPVKGLGRLFSMRTVVRTGLASLKLLAVMATISLTTWFELAAISSIDGIDPGPPLLVANRVLIKAAIAALVAIVAIGLIDLMFQRWQHSKDLRMSKQEVREEHKNQEGDPHIKARVRQVQRELASRRMMDDVPDATVVVTNPTHYAVALKYDREGVEGSAPRVVAKGVDQVAQRIKQLARESEVLCFENVPLARALHARCEIGDVIPEDLFEAVASVLAYVYRVQGERLTAAV